MNLLTGIKGDCYIVDNIELDSDIKRRLLMLGLTDGTKVTILNNKRNGSVIFNVRGTRFAVGKKIAVGITVHREGEK